MTKSEFKRTLIAAVVGLALLAIATSPFISMLLVRREANAIVQDSLTGLALSSEITINISDGFLETTRALNATNAADREVFIQRVKDKTFKNDRNFDRYQTAVSSPAERKAYEDVLETRSRYRDVRDKLFNLLETSPRAEARHFFQDECLPHFNDYLEAMERLVTHNVSESTGRGAGIARTVNGMLIVQGVLLVFFCVYGFFVPALTLYERLSRRTIED